VDLLGVLLPQRCAVCALPGAELCSGCRDAFRRLTGPGCSRCAAPTAWPVARCRECTGRRLAFASAQAAIVYDRAAAQFVRSWKERGLQRLSSIAADLVAETVLCPSGALTYVPSDQKRARERGHHPAERLAGELAGRGNRRRDLREPVLEMAHLLADLVLQAGTHLLLGLRAFGAVHVLGQSHHHCARLEIAAQSIDVSHVGLLGSPCVYLHGSGDAAGRITDSYADSAIPNVQAEETQ